MFSEYRSPFQSNYDQPIRLKTSPRKPMKTSKFTDSRNILPLLQEARISSNSYEKPQQSNVQYQPSNQASPNMSNQPMDPVDYVSKFNDSRNKMLTLKEARISSNSYEKPQQSNDVQYQPNYHRYLASPNVSNEKMGPSPNVPNQQSNVQPQPSYQATPNVSNQQMTPADCGPRPVDYTPWHSRSDYSRSSNNSFSYSAGYDTGITDQLFYTRQRSFLGSSALGRLSNTKQSQTPTQSGGEMCSMICSARPCKTDLTSFASTIEGELKDLEKRYVDTLGKLGVAEKELDLSYSENGRKICNKCKVPPHPEKLSQDASCMIASFENMHGEIDKMSRHLQSVSLDMVAKECVC